MATKRMIHASFWTSETVAQWTFRQRLLFIGLFSNADDQGRIRAHAALIRSTVFPYDDIPLDEINSDIQTIAESEAITIYENDGKALLQVTNWWAYQRPKWAWPSEYAAPDGWTDRLRYRRGNLTVKENWDDDNDVDDTVSHSDTAMTPEQDQNDTVVVSAPSTRNSISNSDSDSIKGRGSDSSAPAQNPAPARDYLTDILSHNSKKTKDSRKNGWDDCAEPIYTVCQRVADLWCKSIMPSGRHGDRVETWQAGASELLRYHEGDVPATLETIDRYHVHYEAGEDFTITGPQSLVNVIPPFLASSERPRAGPLAGMQALAKEEGWA